MEKEAEGPRREKQGMKWEYGLSSGPRARTRRPAAGREKRFGGSHEPRRHSQERYTVKYIGVTNGQIGILSTKRPIPRMSYMEACPRSPLPMIYASVSRKVLPGPETNENFLKEELSFIETHARSRLIKPTPKNLSPTSEEQYLVHKYSLPRGLVALRKPSEDSLLDTALHPQQSGYALRFELEKQKRFPTPRLRRGMSGWMLSSVRLEEQPALQGYVRKRVQERPTATSEITGEIYLKYLRLKALQREKDKSPARSEGGCI
jgi:hypothetical protein